MARTSLNNISPFELWNKLNVSEKHCMFTWSRTQFGWKRIITFNPVDEYRFAVNDNHIGLENFINKNKGKLIFGFISYNLGYRLLRIKNKAKDDLNLPLIHFYAYDNFVEFDGNEIIFHGDQNSFQNKIEKILSREEKSHISKPEIKFQVKIGKEKYEENIYKIQNLIKDGEVYQVNYTHRMQAESNQDKRKIFEHLIYQNPVNYACYFESHDYSICSLSPERFIHISGKNIVSNPIKGTRKRGSNKSEDKMIEQELRQNAKEQAELYMITDLIRNDLGKVCQIGSVKVEHSKKVQRLPKVMHTYSVVKGKLLQDTSPVKALLSMFPGGSITGCPKKRAMEIIDEIEPLQRGVYTGSLGYILPNGDLEFNIAIRTVIQKQNKLYLGVGGGITIESNAEAEYEETLAKASSFF